MIIFPFYNFSDFDRSTFIVYRGNYYYFQNHIDFTYDIVSNFLLKFIIFLHLIFIKFTMEKFISHDNFSLLKFFIFFGFFLVRWTLYLLQTRVFNDPIFSRFYIFLLLKFIFYIKIMKNLHDIVSIFSQKFFIFSFFFYIKIYL